METSLLIQYVIIAVLLIAAFYYIFKIFRKKFSLRRKGSNSNNCDSDCGCS